MIKNIKKIALIFVLMLPVAEAKIYRLKPDVGGKEAKLIKTAKSYLGTRYRLGGNNRKSIDCSGFTKAVFKRHGKTIPRTSYTQIKIGKKKTKRNAEKGDLIFFGDSSRHVGHVGIIIDPIKKTMIHASSARGKVVISSYNTKYYNNKYRGIREVI